MLRDEIYYYFGTSTKSVYTDYALDYNKNLNKTNFYINSKYIENSSFDELSINKYIFDKDNIQSFSPFYQLKFLKEIKNMGYKDFVFLSDQPYKFSFAILCNIINLNFSIFIHDPEPHFGEKFYKKYFNLFFLILIKYLNIKIISHPSFSLKKNNWSPIYLPANGVIFNESLSNIRDIDVFYYGRNEKYKNIDSIFDLADNNVDLKFIIASNRLKISRTSDNISLLDTYLESNELGLYINRSKFIILPYYHGTGTSIIGNALISGCNVILSINVAHFITGIPIELHNYIHIYDMTKAYKIPEFKSLSKSDLILAKEFFSINSFINKVANAIHNI